MANGRATGPGAGGRSSSYAPPAIIDAHCHVFNASDLPSISFIRVVVRERYESGGNFVDLIVGFIANLLVGNAPRAADELADIEGRERPLLEISSPPEGDFADPSPPVRSRPKSKAEAKGEDDNEPQASSIPFFIRSAAGLAGASRSELDRLIRWAKLFNKSRRGLIRMLTKIYEKSGHHCVLVAPALVDFNAWLREPEQKHQQLNDQVKVMGAIARQPGKTRVHGYVGFDPVRAILANANRLPANVTSLKSYNPHDLVREAITKHGFLGVKLYPPMGFRALKNTEGITFPDEVKREVRPGITDRDLGRAIDAELEKLYGYCAEHGVPILAHCSNSNGAGTCYGWRASPEYWDQVIEKFSPQEHPLRICLAHLCSFSAHSSHKDCIPAGTIAEVWENVFGGIIAQPKGEYAFADMSYFQELLDRKPGWEQRRAKVVSQFRTFRVSHDANMDHLCYGSDWLMLGAEERHKHHHEEVGKFLHDAGCSREQISKVFFGNALKFLGLRQGDKNRERLEKFYRDNHIWDQFPQLEAMT